MTDKHWSRYEYPIQTDKERLESMHDALDRYEGKEDKASLAHAKALQEAIERESK